MASGHVNRTQRPNTWLHRPSLRREDSPCQLGAVHTWPLTSFTALQKCGRYSGQTAPSGLTGSAAFDPNVWSGRALQENFVELAASGLALMYPAFSWSIGSWPQWISARVRSH